MSSQDHLQPPSRLKLCGDYVLFLDENQGCWTCGYSVEPPHQKLWLSGGPNGDILSTTLDEFLITFALFEAVMSSPFFLGSEEIDSHTKLRLPFTPLRHASLYVWDEPVEFWISEDERTIYYAHCGFGWLGSYSEESIRACHPTGAEGEKFDFDPWAPATYVGGKATRFQHKRPYVFPYSFGIWTYAGIWFATLLIPLALASFSPGAASLLGVVLSTLWIRIMSETCRDHTGPLGLLFVAVQILAVFAWLAVAVRVLKQFVP